LISILLLLLYTRRFEREMSGGEPSTLMTLKPLKRERSSGRSAGYRDVPVPTSRSVRIKSIERSKVRRRSGATAVPAQGLFAVDDRAVATEDRDLRRCAPGRRA